MKYFPFLPIFLFACSSHPTGENNNALQADGQTIFPLDFAKTSLENDTNTFFVVDRTLAIEVFPDSNWVKTERKKMSDEDWKKSMMNKSMYQSQALKLLEKRGISVPLFPPSRRYFKFIKSNHEVYGIDRSKLKDKWGMILFQVDKDPVFWTGSFPDTDVEVIFGK